jgi:hypothetical protein
MVEFTRKCSTIQVVRQIKAIGAIVTLADAIVFNGIRPLDTAHQHS